MMSARWIVISSILVSSAAAQAGTREDCMQHRDKKLSREACTTAINAGGDVAWAYYHRGLDEFILDQNSAFADYTKAIELAPGMAEAYRERGWLYMQTIKPELAVADLDKAIAITPNDPVAYNIRGMAYRAYQFGVQPDNDHAIADFTKAIELKPDFAYAYQNRGKSWRDKKDFVQAIADFTKSLELDPTNGITYTERGVAHVLKGEYALAIADQEKAVELAPSYYRGTVYFNRGLAYFAAGNREKALADIDKAIEISPKERRYVEFREKISPAPNGLTLRPPPK